eukprot:TRINITY_DN67081_c11_g1_i1.p1 TRINITY_DN67081_c11_g1~~TRINITY_DN67081_c11_g1_i1.p1  ORF type:complete len:221 (-),score=24.91 TRINITY_DN67081_c11_g1_i1:167-829(-)
MPHKNKKQADDDGWSTAGAKQKEKKQAYLTKKEEKLQERKQSWTKSWFATQIQRYNEILQQEIVGRKERLMEDPVSTQIGGRPTEYSVADSGGDMWDVCTGRVRRNQGLETYNKQKPGGTLQQHEGIDLVRVGTERHVLLFWLVQACVFHFPGLSWDVKSFLWTFLSEQKGTWLTAEWQGRPLRSSTLDIKPMSKSQKRRAAKRNKQQRESDNLKSDQSL